MGADRHSIIEAAEQMRSAVSTMEEIMRIAGHSEIHRGDRIKIQSGVDELEDNCPTLLQSIMNAALALRDDWPEIELNKARIRETEKFFEQYQKFKAAVLDFDDWRCQCYDGEEIFPEAHEIAMSMVLLCGRCDEQLTSTAKMLDELDHCGFSSDDQLLAFEKQMQEFCDIPSDGYLIEQIRFTKDSIFKATWHGAKNELTYFADWFRKDSAQIRMIFDFPEDKKTKGRFEISKHPANKLQESNRLRMLLNK